MPDMYDKLGDMLNDVLESGKIPQNDRDKQSEDTSESGHFLFNKEKKINENNKKTSSKSQNSAENDNKSSKNASKTAFSTGEIIKLHNYTYNMQLPPHIQKALSTLDIAYPFTQKDIQKQYHKLLKENHPDTKNTIQLSQDVKNIRQTTVDEIKESYKILCDFFCIQ